MLIWLFYAFVDGCSSPSPPLSLQKWLPVCLFLVFCLSACSAGKWGPFLGDDIFFCGGGGGGGTYQLNILVPPTKIQAPPPPPSWIYISIHSPSTKLENKSHEQVRIALKFGYFAIVYSSLSSSRGYIALCETLHRVITAIQDFFLVPHHTSPNKRKVTEVTCWPHEFTSGYIINIVHDLELNIP